MQHSTLLQALLEARPKVRNSTNEFLIQFVHERYETAIAGIPEYETLEGEVPLRDAQGRFERDDLGLVKSERKRVSKRAHVAKPLLDAIERAEAGYSDFLTSYVDDRTARQMYAAIASQLKDEGFSLPINEREDRDGAARQAELYAEHVARNREQVARLLEQTEAGRKALALIRGETAPAPVAKKKAAA